MSWMLRTWMFLALGATAALTAQAGRPPAGPWAFTQQSAVVLKLPTSMRRAAGAELEYDDAAPVKGAMLDLNGDDVADFLLQSAPSLCGNGGCVYALYDGKTRKKVGEFLGSALYVQAERTHGYPRIAAYSRLSAASANYTESAFNGTTYVVSAARTVDGPALDRLLESLRQIPIRQPGTATGK